MKSWKTNGAFMDYYLTKHKYWFDYFNPDGAAQSIFDGIL
jgi:hypothetical protein